MSTYLIPRLRSPRTQGAEGGPTGLTSASTDFEQRPPESLSDNGPIDSRRAGRRKAEGRLRARVSCVLACRLRLPRS